MFYNNNNNTQENNNKKRNTIPIEQKKSKTNHQIEKIATAAEKNVPKTVSSEYNDKRKERR